MQPPLPQEVADVLAQAAACADALDVDGAINLYNQVLAKAPKCLHALNGLGDALLQRGDREGAIAALRQSVLISPEGDADRYMNLGQLEEGADALLFLERGISILRGERSEAETAQKGSHTAASASGSEVDPLIGTTHALASALCSLAEVFLTDFCDHPDAESRCEGAATEAVALVRPLAEEHQIPEPYVTCASLRLSQSRPDDAKPLLEMALAIIRAADEASPPAFDARKACAKLLMEVDQAAQALELLQVLRLEHDDSLEVWYLTCCAALQADEPALALEEANAACEFAQSERCPPDEAEWLGSLEEVREDARAACAGTDDME